MQTYAGIDWASRLHALCVVDQDGRQLENETYTHTEAGIRAMTATMTSRGVERVAIERPDGILVDRLLDAGLVVSAVRSNTLKATRPRYEAAGGKSDSFDAFCLAELARTDFHLHPLLHPDSPETRILRMLTRVREDLVKTRVTLANRLRAQLEDFWPGAARIFADVDSKIGLAFISRYPSPIHAEHLEERKLVEFLKEQRYRNHRTPTELIQRLRSAPETPIGTAESESRGAVVLSLASVLGPVVREIIDLSAEISRKTYEHPDGMVFLPLFKYPNAVITAALLIAEIGDDRARYPTPDVLAAKAGMTPVARESGKRKQALFRYACDKRLRLAVSNLANSTRQHNPWASSVYDAARERGHNHPHALRILGRAWLRVLWRCWQDRVPYDPAKHGSRQRFSATVT